MGRRPKKQPRYVPAEWPEPGLELRVLIEDSDEGSRWATRRLLERSGFETAECPGPDLARGGECPVAHGERCTIADGADAIVFSLSLRESETREILAWHRRHLLERPVCVEVTRPELSDKRHLVEGCTVVDPSGLGNLASALTSAIAARPDGLRTRDET